MSQLGKKTAVAGWVDGNGSADAAFHDMLLRKATGELSPSLKVPPSYALIARTLCYGREPGQTLEGKKFGAIPPRNFFKVAMDLFEQKKAPFLKFHMTRVLRGQESVETFYKALGDQLQNCITEAMRDSDKYQALSPATLRARRKRKVQPNESAIPLIDTGRLINSLSMEIRDVP